MTIGERLKLIRQRNNLSLADTARIFEITPQSLSRYENGRRTPDNGFLESFGRHFGLSGSWLLYGEPPIFKTLGTPARDRKDIFLELLDALMGPGGPGVEDSPGLIKVPAELSGDSPDNFLSMLEYMVKDEITRKNMFQFFWLFQKGEADKRRLSTSASSRSDK